MDTMKETKTVTIVVEGTPHEWPKNSEITYTQIVSLEFSDFAQHPETTYSIGLVAVWCRSFDSVMCSKGDDAWAQSGRMNFARTRCGSR
jgi:Multiubiquitin